jgi:hypothetical protein
MGAFTSALALGLTAYGTLRAGAQQQAAYNYNAALYQQEAQAIEGQKTLTKEQREHGKKKLAGAVTTAISAQNRDYSGSALLVANDALTQYEMDTAIELYNLEIGKSQALSAATKATREGRYARDKSYFDTGTSILTQGNDWYQKYGGFGKATT